MLVLLAICVVAGVAVAVTPKISLQAEDGVTTISVGGINDVPKVTTVEAFCNFTCTPSWTVIESADGVVESDQTLPSFSGPEATFTAKKTGTIHLVVRANNAIASLTLKVVD
jgi:hypothetical protein